MSKNKIIGGVVLVLVVVGAVLLGLKMQKEQGYSVVYMATGEVYIGKLATFPSLELRDAYQFQATKDATDPTKNTFKLQPLKDALWAPKVLYLVKDNVAFYGPLMSDSVIAKKLAEQNK
ncbi:hypothetical protein A3D42_03145 [Candidatus Nomurabacteria bacterium RIFCSPHIGHO2_02_FULL_41_18]|uniref:Uncharacterized protein n=1 Tax=Candidatus Nomurabacteria bacterium RIFCSPHIGHO2_02_FULL_41_18 TaxID=1801754 RepID=A0A1F6W830_9BACT|nr:MAG: hypothetical protein A3D42_03145 [Candidatus Nomurabacteria bacterium RIFCSPHIGHO2_02_FULL_41_18]